MGATRGGGCCSPRDSPTRWTYQRAPPTALGPCPATWDTLAPGVPVPAAPCRPVGCGDRTRTDSKPPTLLPQDFPWVLLQPGSHRSASESLNRRRPRTPSVKWGNTTRATTGSRREHSSLPPTAALSWPHCTRGLASPLSLRSTLGVALAFCWHLGGQLTQDPTETK